VHPSASFSAAIRVRIENTPGAFARLAGRHRPERLSEPDQQRARLPRRLPRRARRPRAHDRPHSRAAPPGARSLPRRSLP